VAISQKLLNEGEHVVVTTRTHLKVLLLPLLAAVVCIAFAEYVQLATGSGPLHLAVWVLMLIGVVWLFVRPLLTWLATTYTITDRRLITRRGVFTRRGHDIPLTRISDVEYEFGLIDRMLGCGTLRIADASTDGEVVLHDIPQVEQVQRTLNELLQEERSGDGV
jgi:uncharacterized membrane protein YdbT with pleckstrin-like domain